MYCGSSKIADDIFDQNENWILVSLILAENFEEKYTRIQLSFRPKISSAILAKIMKILHTRIDPSPPKPEQLISFNKAKGEKE
jgi:hypothetical protein